MVNAEEKRQKAISNKLETRRETLGLTQKQAAKLADMSLRTYQRAVDENGSAPDMGLIAPICEAFGVPLGELESAPMAAFEKPSKLKLFELIAELDDQDAARLLKFAEATPDEIETALDAIKALRGEISPEDEEDDEVTREEPPDLDEET